MAAYIVFTRESTKNQAELATYSQMAGDPLAGLPVRRAPFMAARKCLRERRSKA